MFRAIVLFCAMLALTKGHTTHVSQCLLPSSGPLPINVYIHGCDIQPCMFEQGRDAVLEIEFRAPYDIQRMSTVAFAYLSPIPFPYSLGEMSETCNFLSNTNCPVVQGKDIQYTLRVHIEDFLPVGTQLPIEFRIQDDSNRNIMCLRTQVRIVAGNKKIEVQSSTIMTVPKL